MGVNLAKFVRFDHFGIYGIHNNDGVFDPNEITDGVSGEEKIWRDAQFGMTWNGFFVKNKYGTHYVEVSSANDIQVVKNDGTARLKIGKLSDDNFGLRINDNNGNAVLETGSDGSLWLKKQLSISNTSGTDYEIAIGYLDKTKPSTQIHEVFDANNKFIVYEDGSVVAKSIEATGGKIGNLTIGEIEETIEDVQKLDIFSNLGYTFNIKGNTAEPADLLLEAAWTGITPPLDSTYEWSWTKDFENWFTLSSTSSTCQISYNSISESLGHLNNFYVRLKCTIGTNNYEAIKTIYRTFSGESPYTVVIDSSTGTLFLNKDISATLIATVYYGNEDVTANFPFTAFSWEKYNAQGNLDEEWTEGHKSWGNRLTITADDIFKKAKFACNIEIEEA